MIRPTQDNVLLLLDPDIPTETASGIAIVQFEKSKAYANRMGQVLAVGPGHEDKRGVFQPTQIKVGERVVVPVLAGDNYTYQKRQDFAEMYGLEGDNWELRMVREDEILAVIECAAHRFIDGDECADCGKSGKAIAASEVREGAAAAE